jgi:hypothetical protein
VSLQVTVGTLEHWCCCNIPKHTSLACQAGGCCISTANLNRTADVCVQCHTFTAYGCSLRYDTHSEGLMDGRCACQFFSDPCVTGSLGCSVRSPYQPRLPSSNRCCMQLKVLKDFRNWHCPAKVVVKLTQVITKKAMINYMQRTQVPVCARTRPPCRVPVTVSRSS